MNKTCGLHVHVDMRQRDWRTAYARLYRALPWLYALVSPSRRSNETGYCARPRSPTPPTIGRYHALNPRSVKHHKTLEVRLHHGTIDAEKISRWVELILAVVGGPDLRRCPRDLWGFACAYSLPWSLTEWVARRAAELGSAAAEGLRLPRDLATARIVEA